MAIAKATTPLVQDQTLISVSCSQARVLAASAWPPQSSTTGLPSSSTATLPPCSRPEAKFAAKASRTRAKRGSVVPAIGAVAIGGQLARVYAQGRSAR